MLEALKNDLSGRYHEYDEKGEMYLQIAHTNNEEAALVYKEEIMKEFPGYDIHMDPLSLSVSCHIGPGALAFACCKKIDA